MGKSVLALIATLGLIGAQPALAEPAAPVFQAPVTALEFGVVCRPASIERSPAPLTELGYIENITKAPKILRNQRTLPADLGLGFVVIARATQDLRVVKKSYRPGRVAPESWESGLAANSTSGAVFTFDRPEEQIPGIWVMEAWDGTQRLYRVEFLVTPPGSDPELIGICGAMTS